ncbi:MAG: hypothetical protein WBC51_26545 [Vicinamibacterales bacterium]
MNTRAKVRRLVVSIVAAAFFGVALVGLAQSASPRVTSVPICLKPNGQLRVLMGGAGTCDSSEQQTEWVVSGEVTDITLGQGLTGRRDGGTIQLAVNPALLERGRVFSGFNDGPVPLPRESGQIDIATLELPAGYFAIFAKLTVVNNGFNDDENARDRVICKLNALPDFDNAETLVEENGVFFREAMAGLTMQLVHKFSSPGSVTLSCYEDDSIPDLYFTNLKITAIEASSVSNVFLPVP